MAALRLQRLSASAQLLLRVKSRLPASSAFSSSNSTASENILRSKQPEITVRPDQTLTEFLWDRVQDWGDAPYTECGVSGRKYTFAELYRYSRGLSTALSKLGVQPGEVVGVVLQNLPEYPIAIFGCLDIGAVASPVNPGYTFAEIQRQLAYSGASYVICSDLYAQAVIDAVKEQGASSKIKHVIVIGDETPAGCLSFFSLMKTIPAISIYLSGVQNNQDQLALLPFSSGTTGPPKGVMQSHANLIANVLQFSQPEVCQLDTLGSGKPQDRLLGVLPMFHCYGSTVFLLCATYKGANVLTLPKFAPPSYVGAIKSFKPTLIHFVTPLINFMVQSDQLQTQDLASLKGVVAGAAPIGAELIQMFLKKVGRPIFFQEAYGMTEFSPLTHIIPVSSWNSKPSSCGVLIANTECKIVDDTGKVVGPNERGELWIRGPQAMKGYYKNQKATDETIDSEGWVRTGDIGYYDQDEHFYIVDRLKELIKVKGFQVAPSELEGVLRDHPQVADVAVIGVPDPESGEVPRAYIVKGDQGLADADLHKYLAGKLASFKQLKGGVEFVEAIPKSPAGKILRRELVAAYKAKL